MWWKSVASPYGVGAILSHKEKENDGSDSPIAYVSRSLSDAEFNYPQTHREAFILV